MSESSAPALDPTTHESPWGNSSGLSEHRFPTAPSEDGQLGGLKGWKTSQEPTELTLCPTVAVYHTLMNTHAHLPTYTLSHTHIPYHKLSHTHSQSYAPIQSYMMLHTLVCVQLPHHLERAVLPRALTVAQVTVWHHPFLCYVTS